MIRPTLWIRLCQRYNLIFFGTLLLLSCEKKQETVSVRWDNERPAAIIIPQKFSDNVAKPFDDHIAIRLASTSEPVSILGDFSDTDDGIEFTPLIPLTRGLTYEVWIDKSRVGEIQIPFPDERPSLLSIYPTQDTVPMNLLKMYLKFSRPIREGVALRYITVLKNNSDTVEGVFLDLQPELWNEDRTLLTLWLDPGRIKRDLQPNKRMGSPLTEGDTYSVLISEQWTDDRGAPLATSSQKNFTVSSRDSLSPDPRQWKIIPPTAGSVQPLHVRLGDPLDYSLLMSALQIVTKHGDNIEGEWQATDAERQMKFTPEEKWEAGEYAIRIETRLEDLAGNNINRPFEVDLHTQQKKSDTVSFRSLSFVIE